MKTKINWLFFGILMLIFISGFFMGMALGIKAGQMILFEGINIGLKDSNIEVTIDVNETTLVNEVNKTIVPYLIETIQKENTELKEQIGKDVWKLEVKCIKYDNDGWMNTTTITTHIHSFKYYQTYSDYKEMVEGYEECEVRE